MLFYHKRIIRNFKHDVHAWILLQIRNIYYRLHADLLRYIVLSRNGAVKRWGLNQYRKLEHCNKTYL